MDAVSIKDVSLAYHNGEGETLALDHINIDVPSGGFVAIVGPSGCGKSTLLSIVAGLIRPSGGEVHISGDLVNGPSPYTGYMLQRDHLFEWETIGKNVLLGLRVRGTATGKERQKTTQMLESYGLGRFLNHYPYELSGGMRQKVALIRTLATEPTLLLLDEPFSALDYQTRLTIADEISAIIKAKGKTAILVTHDISEAISIADTVYVFSERPARVKARFDIELEETPLARRSDPRFRQYFDSIWKELDVRAD